MEANRQGLHLAEALAPADHVPAPTTGTNEELVRGLHRDKDAAILDFGSGRTITLGNTKNLMQQRLFHAANPYQLSLEKAQTFRKNQDFQYYLPERKGGVG